MDRSHLWRQGWLQRSNRTSLGWHGVGTNETMHTCAQELGSDAGNLLGTSCVAFQACPGFTAQAQVYSGGVIAAAPHGVSPDGITDLLQPARDRAAALALCPKAWHCPGMTLLFLCSSLRNSHMSSPSHPSGNAKDQGCFCRQQGGQSGKCGVISLVASPDRTKVLAALPGC